MLSDIYFNLRTRLWSMRNRRTGRVDGHAPVLVFEGPVQFVVQPAGRAQVLRSGQKSVHAFVRGADPLQPATPPDTNGMVRASYNPFKAGHFVRLDTGAPLVHAARAVLIARPHASPEVWITPLPQ